MMWLQPAAWLGLVAVAAPLLIHLLVHRRSDPLPFPTLQFLVPTRLASLRRHRLDDLPLLLVRATILAAVVAALAGPLMVTASRRASWNRRVARAIVVDSTEPGRPSRVRAAEQEALSAFRSTVIETADLGAGMRRAAAWLDEVPPARREIVFVSPLAIGAVTAADLSTVPAAIGIRFVRSELLPQTRTVSVAPVLTSPGTQAGAHGNNVQPPLRTDLHVGALVVRQRTVTLNGRQTSVRDAGDESPATMPIDIVASAGARQIVAAAVGAVLAERTLAPEASRTARLVIADAPEAGNIRASAVAIHTPWIGDAVARIVSDDDVAIVAREAKTSADVSLRSGPWQPIASDADGAPLVAAAQIGSKLLVIDLASAESFLTPVLIRSMLNAISAPPNLQGSEIVSIDDAQLRAWTRPAGPALMPNVHHPAEDLPDDRRWFWAAALCLLALERWMRSGARSAGGVGQSLENVDRVA